MKQTKLPVITIQDWLAAEAEIQKGELQPPNSMTAEQYAEATGRGITAARSALRTLLDAGRATRTRWRSGQSGQRYVYFLTKKMTRA